MRYARESRSWRSLYRPTPRLCSSVVFIRPGPIGWLVRARAGKTVLPAGLKSSSHGARPLTGSKEYERLEVLYWLHESRRDLVRQSPRNDGIARGTFSLRTPARPNPIGTQITKLLRVDGANVFVRGLDCLDGTPLLDLKPDRCAFTPLAPRQRGDDQVGDPE